MLQPKNKPDYTTNVYNALKDNLSGFDKTETQFREAMADPAYVTKVYGALKDNLSGFDKSPEQFTSLVGVKKKVPSASTSQNQKPASETQSGSSGTSKFRLAGEQDVIELQKRSQMASDAEIKSNTVNTKNGNSFDMDGNRDNSDLELEQQDAQYKKQASNPEISRVYNNYVAATTVSDEQKNQIKEEVEAEAANSGFWRNFKSGGKELWNKTADAITTIGSFGQATTAPDWAKADVNPLTEEKAQAKKELQAQAMTAREEKKPAPVITNEAITERAKEIAYNKRVDQLRVSQAEDFLSNSEDIKTGLHSNERTDLNEFVNNRYGSLSLRDKTNAKKMELLVPALENSVTRLAELSKDITDYRNRGEDIPENIATEYKTGVAEYQRALAEAKATQDDIASNREELGKAEENLDLLKRTYDFGKNFNGRIEASTKDLISGLLGFYAYANIGNPQQNMLAFDALEEAQSMNIETEKLRAGLRRPKSIEGINNLKDFGNYTFDLIAEQLPVLAATATGSGGVASITASATGNKFTEMYGEMMQGTQEYDELQLAGIPLLFGATEGLSASLDLYLIKGSGRVLNSATAAERELITKGFAEKMLEGVTNTTKGVAMEGLDEGATQLSQNLIDIYMGGKTDKGVWDGVNDAAAAGVLMGGLISSPNAIKPLVKEIAKPFTTDNQIQAISKDILTLENQLGNPELSETARTTIETQLGKAEGKQKQLLEKVVGKVSNMPEEDFNKIVSIESQQARLRAEGNRTSTDPTYDDAARELVMGNLEEEFKSLEQQRLEILSPKVKVNDKNVVNTDAETKPADGGDTNVVTKPVVTNETVTENEGTTTDAPAADGNLRPGNDTVGENGAAVGASDTAQTPQPSPERGTDTPVADAKRVKVAAVKNAEFDVYFDAEGNISKITSAIDGREVPKRVERKGRNGKVTLVSNGNYSSIEAEAKGATTENRLNEERKQRVTQALDNFTPTDAYQQSINYFARGGNVSSKSAQKETGFSKKEVSWATGFKPETELPSIEAAAENIVENSAQELDVQDVRNALIEILQSKTGRNQIEDEIVSLYSENVLRAEEEELRAYLGSLSESDLAMYEAVKAEQDYLSELSDEEVYEYYAEKYNEYEQGRQAAEAVDAGGNAGPESTTAAPAAENTAEPAGETEGVDSVEGAVDLSESLGLNQFIANLDKAIDNLDKFGKETLGVNIPVVAARQALKAMKIAALTAKTVAEVISAGLNALKETDWYKNLSTKDKQDIDENFITRLNEPLAVERGKSRSKIEEEVDALIADGMNEEDVLKQYTSRTQKMMAKDHIERQKEVTPEQAREQVDASYKKAEEVFKDKKPLVDKINDGFRKFATRIFDRQFVPKFILNKAGGRTVRNYMIAAKGASGYANAQYQDVHKKVYRGLSNEQIKILDKVIQLRRFIAIDENRRKENLPAVVHPDYINDNVSKAYFESLKNDLGETKFADMMKRADAYFDAFRSLLNDMEKSGLISKASKERFFEIDYQPREFLEFLKDAEDNVQQIETSTGGLNDPQIRKLENGLDTALISDSQYLLSRAMNVRARSIAQNNTNKKLAEFMRTQREKVAALREKENQTKKERDTIKYFDLLEKAVKENPIVDFNDKGQPVYLVKKLSEGYRNAYYYTNGVKQNLLMEQGFYEQYYDALKGVFNSPNTKEAFALASGTALVKSIATGYNPTFFITNTPRDLLFIATFSEEYGNNVLLNLAKIAKDAALGVADIQKNTDTYKNFVKYGGMMDFLKDQGKFKGTRGVNKLLDKVDNRVKEKTNSIFNILSLSKLSSFSELGFRMAVFRRAIQNQFKELGVKNEEELRTKFPLEAEDMIDDVYTNAVASARSTMDFNQGGVWTKDADAVIPYLNAATQGTRVMLDNFRERPLETMLRVSQSAGILSSIPIGISLAFLAASRDDDDKRSSGEIYKDALSGVSQYDRVNYFIVFTGNKDENGEYEFYRVAKPQQLTPFISIAEATTLKAMDGKDASNPYRDVSFALSKNISPVDFDPVGNLVKNPGVKALLSYKTGVDFYNDRPVSWLNGKVPPAVEGFENSNVEDFYKNIGENQGMSPARMKAAVEAMITTPATSPYVGFLYGGMDALASDKDSKVILDKLKEDLQRSTVKRAVKNTTEYNRKMNSREGIEKKLEQANIENLKEKMKFRELADGIADGTVTTEEVSKELVAVAKDNPAEAKRLVRMMKERIKNKGVPSIVFEIKYASSAKEKAILLEEVFGDGLKDIGKMSPEEKKLIMQMKAKGVLSNEVIIEYRNMVK